MPFVDTWHHYWTHTVLVQARAAGEKLRGQLEWPSIWECQEVFLALMKLAREKPFHDSSMSGDEQLHALNDGSDVQAKLQDRLPMVILQFWPVRAVDAFQREVQCRSVSTKCRDVMRPQLQSELSVLAFRARYEENRVVCVTWLQLALGLRHTGPRLCQLRRFEQRLSDRARDVAQAEDHGS